MGQPKRSSGKSDIFRFTILSIVFVFIFLAGYRALATADFWDDIQVSD